MRKKKKKSQEIVSRRRIDYALPYRGRILSRCNASLLVGPVPRLTSDTKNYTGDITVNDGADKDLYGIRELGMMGKRQRNHIFFSLGA